jgi:predicted Rossmann-fold nucleotide-binding protein
MLSQMHVGRISKKFGILNVGNYYDATLEQLRKAKELDFMSAEIHDLIKVGLTAKELFNKLIVGEAYKIDRWEDSRRV